MTETKLEMLKVTNYLAFTGRFSPLGVHVCNKCRYQPSELLGWSFAMFKAGLSLQMNQNTLTSNPTVMISEGHDRGTSGTK